MSDLKEKKFGYIVNNQPCPGHLHPPYPPMPPPIPGVTMKDLIQYVNSYIDVRAKQIYEKIKEQWGGIDKQEIIDAVIAQIRTEIGDEVSRYISNHYNFEEMIDQKIAQIDILTPSSPEIKNLSSSINEISTTVQGLETSVSNLNTTVQGLGSSVEELDGKVSVVEASVQDLGDSITTIEGNVTALTTSMSNINNKVDALVASASNFATKDSVSQVEAQVSALSSAMTSYATNSRVAAIEASVSSMGSQLTSLSNQVSNILGDWASVKERTSQIPGILSDISDLKAAAQTFATKDYVDAEVDALNLALSSYATNDRVDGLEASVSATNDRVDVIESMLLFDDLTI